MICMMLHCVRPISVDIGMLNDVFVSRFPGVVGIPFHPQWSVTFILVCQFVGLLLLCLQSCFMFPNFF